MDKKILGSMVSYERNKNKISMRMLADGLCSISALQRLENGERLPDYFVLERLIERLGLSTNKIELLYNEAVYNIYYLREVIEKELAQKNYKEVSNALDYYRQCSEAAEAIHRQYICKIQAVLEGQGKQNHEKAQRLLEEAMLLTVPGLKLGNKFDAQELEDLLLGGDEVLLLLMWIQEKMEQDVSQLWIDSRQILNYIGRICQDEEAKINLYSKAAWVMGNLAIQQKNEEEALWYTMQGENLLTDNGLLLHLPQYLERIVLLTEQLGKESYGEWKKQRDALKELYEEYGEPWDTEQVALWKSYRQQEVYLVSELFGQERRLRNQSQEKLAEELEIDQKTISRLENGKYKPKPGTFQKIKEYLEIDRDICTTRIVVEDFALLELERDIAKLNSQYREAEAEVLFQKLKGQLSLKWKENRQYIKYMDTLFDCELKRISHIEAIESCIEALRITRKGLEPERVGEVVLGRVEAIIVNYIANCYKKIGERQKAIELREKIVQGYKNSKVDLKYHYVALSLCYSNLAVDYEEMNRFAEAIEMNDCKIRLCLRCKRGNFIGNTLAEKRFALDRLEKNNQHSKEKYLQAYQLLKLMKDDKKRISLQRAFNRWYDEEIEDY